MPPSRLYAEAVEADPRLTDRSTERQGPKQPKAWYAYRGICSRSARRLRAGRDAPPPDDMARSRLRARRLAGSRPSCSSIPRCLTAAIPPVRPMASSAFVSGRPNPTWLESVTPTPGQASRARTDRLDRPLGRGSRPAGEGPGRSSLRRPTESAFRRPARRILSHVPTSWPVDSREQGSRGKPHQSSRRMLPVAWIMSPEGSAPRLVSHIRGWPGRGRRVTLNELSKQLS